MEYLLETILSRNIPGVHQVLQMIPLFHHVLPQRCEILLNGQAKVRTPEAAMDPLPVTPVWEVSGAKTAKNDKGINNNIGMGKQFQNRLDI